MAKMMNPSADPNMLLAERNYSLLGDVANLNVSDPRFLQKLLEMKGRLILDMDENYLNSLEA